MTTVFTSPLVRLAVLYLRSRLLGTALAVVGVSAFVGWYLLDQSRDVGVTRLLLTLGSVGAATAVGISARSPFGETERITSFRLWSLRLGHMAGLLVVAALALGLANRVETEPWTDWVLIRNLAGYAGFALLTARLAGASISWLLPTIYAMAAFVTLGGVEVADFSDRQRHWGWPMMPGDDRFSAWLAGGMLGLGLFLIVAGGGRDRVEENS